MAYLNINGVDISALLTKYEWTETPRQIQGKNIGTSITGKEIYDIVATKFDFAHGCKPMTASSYKTLCDFVKSNPVTVEYDSASSNGNRTITALMSVSGANLCIDRTVKYYNNITISFKEQ